jgi:phospholipid/cholesterol/gamma-HCH transport system substrate-binding protein
MKVSPEFKVGLMTSLALLILMVSILFVSNFHFGSGGYMVSASFNFLGDLKVNAPVEYAGGIRVGQVQKVYYANNKALVDLLITDKGFKLRKDSQVALYSTGLLGSRYVQIGADLGGGPELQTGDVIEGRDANNLDLTFSELGDVMESFEKMMGDPKAKANFLKSFENMNKSTDQLYQLTVTSREKVEKILADLSKSSGDVSKLVASAQKVSDSLQGLTSALDKKDVNLAMKDLSATLKNMNQLTSDIHNGKGLAGVLLHDEKAADDLKGLIEELKAHPWKLLWKK